MYNVSYVILIEVKHWTRFDAKILTAPEHIRRSYATAYPDYSMCYITIKYIMEVVLNLRPAPFLT